MITYHVTKTLIINNIIAPHGITDFIHAINKKDYLPLLLTYGASMSVSQKLTPIILNSIYQLPLCIASLIHFHRDFELFFPNKYLSFMANITNLYCLIQIPDPYLYVYMCLLHVPNHYRMAWVYVKHHKWLTILSILSSSFIISKMMMRVNHLWYPSIIGIIIGHIIYGELFIHDNISIFPKKILKIV